MPLEALPGQLAGKRIVPKGNRRGFEGQPVAVKFVEPNLFTPYPVGKQAALYVSGQCALLGVDVALPVVGPVALHGRLYLFGGAGRLVTGGKFGPPGRISWADR